MTTDSILRNATDEQFGLAVEENVYAMFRSMTQVLNGEIAETDQLSRFHAWPSSPIFKDAFRAQLTPNEADAAILDTIEWYKARNAPFFLMMHLPLKMSVLFPK